MQRIIRTQAKDGFVMYEFVYGNQNLLHWNLELLLEDILFYYGINLKKYLFNPIQLN